MTLNELVRQLNLYLEAYPHKADARILVKVGDEVKRLSEFVPLYQDSNTSVWNLLDYDELQELEEDGTYTEDYDEYLVFTGGL